MKTRSKCELIGGKSVCEAAIADGQETYIAESTRLQENMRKQLEKIEDLVGRICGAAQEMQDVVDGEDGGRII